MTFPRDDICLLISLGSVLAAGPELQICRSSCFHAWFPGLPACFEHAKFSLSPGTEHDFPPTVFPTLWIYNNMQGKQHLLLEKLPDSPPSCSGLHAHLLFFYTSSANLSEAISPAKVHLLTCALPSLNSRSLGSHNCVSFSAVPCSL